jgi:hypothetical protein
MDKLSIEEINSRLNEIDDSFFTGSADKIAFLVSDCGYKPSIFYKSGYIAKSTLFRAISMRRRGNNGGKYGRPPFLNLSRGKILLEWIREESIKNHKPSMFEIKEKVLGLVYFQFLFKAISICEVNKSPYETEKIPSRPWVYGYIKSKNDLSYFIPHTLDEKRTPNSTWIYSLGFFEEFQRMCLERDYSFLVNIDEISVSQIDTRKIHVACPSDIHDIYNPEAISYSSTSVCVTTGSNGEAYTSVVLIPHKEVPVEFKDARTSRLAFLPTESGWQTKETFEYIFCNILLDDLNKQRVLNNTQKKPILIILDGTFSHFTPKIGSTALTYNIDIICIPSHLSHLIQPNDRGINAGIKNCLSTFKSYNHISSASEQRKAFITSLKNGLDSGLTRKNILRSWRQSGLCPFNFLHILSKILVFTPLHSFPKSRGIQLMEQNSISGKVLVRCDKMYSYKNVHLQHKKEEMEVFFARERDKIQKDITLLEEKMNSDNFAVSNYYQSKAKVLEEKLSFMNTNKELIIDMPIEIVRGYLDIDSDSFLNLKDLKKVAGTHLNEKESTRVCINDAPHRKTQISFFHRSIQCDNILPPTTVRSSSELCSVHQTLYTSKTSTSSIFPPPFPNTVSSNINYSDLKKRSLFLESETLTTYVKVVSRWPLCPPDFFSGDLPPNLHISDPINHLHSS